jgi:LysM repeat protein
VLLLVFGCWQGQGQDAATEERWSKLSGQIEDLMAAQRVLTTRLDELAKEITDLREEVAKPNPAYASEEELRHLAEAVQEIDQKRLQDYEKIRAELVELGKTLAAPPAQPEASGTNAPSSTNNLSAIPPDNGPWEYVIQPNDALSKIAQTFRREKNLKITVADILKANPGLVAERIRPGQKIVIPAQ